VPLFTPAEEMLSTRSAGNISVFHVELAAMDDIYRAAGIMPPRKGYTVNKVVHMLNSGHMNGLSQEMKRVAVLMALDAAEVTVDEVLRDAKVRQDALDAYEASQRKLVEAEWARKAEEVLHIQAELETIKAHYMARISRNLEGVAREKATFNDWLSLKQKESQNMAEAIEMCLKSTAAPPATEEISPGTAAAAIPQESRIDPRIVAAPSRSDAIH
jgi:hypothetical protein